ncbi:hypothetical protein [Microcoleus sp. bin38.metabat.b11b12b14.051]|nr:hypothetical protein [Microcoleus sp. bin38.metabat.b11b12b14.051]
MHHSIDRERSPLMVGLKRFIACVKLESHAAEILAGLLDLAG